MLSIYSFIEKQIKNSDTDLQLLDLAIDLLIELIRMKNLNNKIEKNKKEVSF